MSRLQTELLVQDISTFYRQVRAEHLRSLEKFDGVFSRCNVEMLFYAGGSPTVPYLVHVIGQLFAISMAYASIPFEATDKSSKFGWMLAYFLFFTQPSIDDVPTRVLLRVSVGTLRSAIHQATTCKDDVLAAILGQFYRAGALHIVPHVDNCIFSQEIFRRHESDGSILVRDERRSVASRDEILLPSDLAAELSAYESQMAQLGIA